MRVISLLTEYDKEYISFVSELAKWIVDFFKIKDNRIVVDVGCGYGALTVPLAKLLKDCKIIAIDKDSDALFRLSTILKSLKIENVEVVESDFKHIKEIESNSVDFVFSHWVISAFLNKPELKQSLGEFCRLMRRGGIMANCDGYPINDSQMIWKKIDEIGFVARWWTVDEIKSVMENLGLKKINTRILKLRQFKVLPQVIVKDAKREKDSDVPALISYLASHKEKIRRLGLEFPPEYVIYGIKL